MIDPAYALERIEACGTPFPRPASEVAVYVTTPGRIAPFARRLAPRTAGSPRTDSIAIPTAVAARLSIRLAPTLGDKPLAIEVVSLVDPTSETDETVSVRRFLVTEPGDESGEVSVPPGPIVVLARQASTSPNAAPRYIAMAGPFDARGESLTNVTLQVPTVPVLVVHLTGPGRPLHVALVASDQQRQEAAGAARSIAGQQLYWPDLDEPEVVIDGESPTAYLEPTSVSPRPRTVELVEVVARRKPAVDVMLTLPPELVPESLALEVARMPGWVPEREVPLPLDTTSWRLEGLPPDTLMLTLHAAPWRFRQRVDLREGEDRTVQFAPEPIALTGTVFRGDEGVAATVAFNVDLRPEKGQVTVASDEWGRYETIVFRPGTYVAQVTAEDGETVEPMREIVEIPDRPHVEWDFHLAARGIEVLVRNAETGAPIENALVSFVNRAEGTNQDDGRPVRTDADGLALTAALRPGTLSVGVTAEGYVEHREEPRALEAFPEEPYIVDLEPIGDTVELLLALADGRPAAGARVYVIANLTAGAPQWSGSADSEGRIGVPAPRRGSSRILLARHPEAAGAIRTWSASTVTDRPSWALPPSAGRPLRLRTTNAEGRAARAEIALWIDGHRVGGLALQLLTGSPPATGRDGSWQATGVPDGPLRVLAFAPNLGDLARSGALDALAERVPYPWPKPFGVIVIER